MKKQYPVVGVCLASALFLALQARAQETQPAEAIQQKAPVADVAQQSALPESMTSGDIMQMDAITVTATRQEQKILNVPQTINVITRQTMDDHNVNNVEEMLRHTPGVHVNRQVSVANSAFGDLGSISMRGVGGNRILTVVDGDRILESAGVQGDVGNRMFVDTQMLKSAEISRGPASTLWGADAMGGMVSYQTIDPDDLLKGREFGGKASLGWDGLNYGKSEHGSMAFQFNDTTQALLGYTHRTYEETRLRRARDRNCGREGFPCDKLPPSHTEVDNVLAKLVYRPNQDHQFKLTGEFFEADTNSHIPFMSATGAALNGYDHRNQDQKRWRFALEHKWDVNANWLDNLKWRISYSEQEREVRRDRNYFTDPTDYMSLYGPMMGAMIGRMMGLSYPYVKPGDHINTRRDTDYEQNFWQADIQLTSSFDWADTSHKLTYGFQGDLTETKYSVEETDYTAGTFKKGSQLSNRMNPLFPNADTTRADLYIQDEIKLFGDRLTVTPGIRRAHYSVDPKGGSGFQDVTGYEARKISENKWLPQIGAIFKFDDTYSTYARYAKGFKMPTAQQLFMSFEGDTMSLIPNPDLKPETVDTYEIGFRGKYDKGWFSVGAFYSDYDDFIAQRQQSPTTISYDNLDQMRIYGVEASGEWQFARNWSLNGSVDWQYAKYEDENGNKTPWNVPPLTAVVGLKWKMPEYNITSELFGTFARAVRRVDKDSEGKDNFKPGGYAVFDGYVNWQMTKNLKLTASVTNILNKRYFDYTAGDWSVDNKTNPANPLELYTAPGRTFAISLQADF